MDLLQVGITSSNVFGYHHCAKNFKGRTAAVNGSDYVERSNVLLTFNAATRSIDVLVDLFDDNLFEGEKDFNGNLTLVADSQRVAIVQGSAVATIVDDEGGQNIQSKSCAHKVIEMLVAN